MRKAGPGSSGLRYPTWREDALPAEPGRPTSRSGPPSVPLPAGGRGGAGSVDRAGGDGSRAPPRPPPVRRRRRRRSASSSRSRTIPQARSRRVLTFRSWPRRRSLRLSTSRARSRAYRCPPSSPAPRPSLAPRSSSRSSLRVHLMKRADSASASARGRRGHETCIRVRGRLSGRADRRRAGRGPRAGRQALLPGHPDHRGPVRRGRAVACRRSFTSRAPRARRRRSAPSWRRPSRRTWGCRSGPSTPS